MEATTTHPFDSKTMMRQVIVNNNSLKKFFQRYNRVTETLMLLEGHPATRQMEITVRMRRHREWLHEHICQLLRPETGGINRMAA